ncbi:MAG: VCBS repeat-containing protein [candidate division WOR-3 bacterium]
MQLIFCYTIAHKGVDFLRGREYYYYGSDTLFWSDNKVRTWNLGLHMYWSNGIRILGQDLDLNGDGLMDIILTNNEWWYAYPYQHVFINSGGRRFSPVYWKYRADGDSMCHDAVWVGDLNGNGIIDYVLSVMDPRSKTGIRVYYDYPFDTSRMVYLKAGSVETPYVADVNMDGYPDILVGVWRDSSQLTPQGRECSKIFFGSPSGYNQWDTTPCLYGAGTHPVFFADLDYDGFLDAYIGSLYYRDWFPPTNPPKVYWNVFGNFYQSVYTDIWFKPTGLDSSGSYGATVADLNRDGYLDIISCAYGYGVVMWGSGVGYSPYNKHEFLSLQDCRNVQAYDINRDGWVDVIFGEKAPLSDWNNGRITIYFNYNGNFSESRKLVIPSSSNYGVFVMDFDGDGWPDILSSRKELDSSSVYWNLGPPFYFDTTLKTNLYSVKASRNLSVQIFGNVYDRSNAFYFLLPSKGLGTNYANARVVKVFGNFSDCCSLKVYIRGYKGGWGDFVEVIPNIPFYDTSLYDIDSAQVLIVAFTNFTGTRRFRLDSIKIGFEISEAELKVGDKGAELKGDKRIIYDILGRRVNIKGRGVYFIKEGKKTKRVILR